jgi:ATP-dependent Clp protease ATP-binding subunit ClpA
MFAILKRKMQDVQTLSALATAAEQVARGAGRVKPGSEHFVLAALGLPDGSAGEVFAALGLSEAGFREALVSQQRQALARVGVELLAEPNESAPRPPAAPAPTLYEAEASGQALVQRLAASAPARAPRALRGADVLLAVAQEEHSVAARAFRLLGVSSQALGEAARGVLAPEAAH